MKADPRSLNFLLFWMLPSFLGAAKPESSKTSKARVQVTSLQKIPYEESLLYPAKMESETESQIFSDISGVVKRLPVRLGERVKAGQVVAEVQSVEEGFDFQPTQLRARFAGVVVALHVREGSRVTASQKLLEILDPSRLQVRIELPENDWARSRSDWKAELLSLDKQIIAPLLLHGMSPSVDSQTGTSPALFRLATPAAVTLGPGQSVFVKISSCPRPIFSAPENAVIRKMNQDLVRLVENHKVVERPVEARPLGNGQVELISGVQENERLILRASRYVKPGEEVEIEGSKDATPSSVSPPPSHP